MSRWPRIRETWVARRAGQSKPTAKPTAVLLLAAVVFTAAAALGARLGFVAGRQSSSTLLKKTKATSDRAPASLSDTGTWVVGGDPGPNAPPIGRSLFDFLTMVDDGNGPKKQIIPFPFPKLIALIQSRIRADGATTGYGLKNVLIPLGRSLQRSASAPDFFLFPRVVVGVDGYPVQDDVGTGAFLRDRLFVGYNEKASVLEIVSYNEAAGRYEFQVAHDYKAGGRAQAVYANRSVCLSCHQNATPIFSDRPWQETNAHPEISDKIRAAMTKAGAAGFDGQNYMGVPLAVPEAQPQGLDNAKFRANLIPATHFLWQRLCDAVDGSAEGSARCRGQVLSFALRMAFTNQLEESSALFFMSDTSAFQSVLMDAWKRQWPKGLVISSPRIPNRNPFEKPHDPSPFNVRDLNPELAGAIGDLIKTSQIPAEFEPLNHRPAFDKWDVTRATAGGATDLTGLGNWLRQIAAFFTATDLVHLDQWASARARAANGRTRVTGVCELIGASASKLSFRCGPDDDAAASSAPGTAEGALRLAGFISWDAKGVATGALEALAVRTGVGCDLAQGAEAAACPEANNLVLRGTVTAAADGTSRATLTAVNRINTQRSRFSDGNLLESISLRWDSSHPVAIAIDILRDFPYLEQAIARGVADTVAGQTNTFARRPLRRTAIMTSLRSALGGPATDPGDCCEADTLMPAPLVDAVGGDGPASSPLTGPAGIFMKECAICHRNQSGFPPNYLTGTADAVNRQLAQCAERIWYRIGMYDLAPADRGQSPMPPVSRLHAIGLDEAQWHDGDSLKTLRAAAAEFLKAKGLAPLDPKQMNYSSLPTCFGNAF